MNEQIKDFLESLVHGPCAGVSYGEFVAWCEREARRLLNVCPACDGIGERKVFGVLLRCGTCHGRGRL